MKRRTFLEGVAASVGALLFPGLPLARTALSLNDISSYPFLGAAQYGGATDPFNEVPTYFWRMWWNGSEYGQYMVLNEPFPELNKSTREKITEVMHLSIRASIDQWGPPRGPILRYEDAQKLMRM